MCENPVIFFKNYNEVVCCSLIIDISISLFLLSSGFLNLRYLAKNKKIKKSAIIIAPNKKNRYSIWPTLISLVNQGSGKKKERIQVLKLLKIRKRKINKNIFIILKTPNNFRNLTY